ncbi:MAG: DUF4349 domain-containing protein [Eubacteriales bacterium]
MNKKSFVLLIVLVLSLVFASCASKSDSALENVAMDKVSYDMDQSMSEPAAMPMDEEEMYYGNGDSTVDSNIAIDYSEKIIYNVNMAIVVDEPVAVAQDIKEKVIAAGGYVSSSYTNKYDDTRSYVNMQVRVPAAGKDDMVNYITSISDVQYNNEYSDNITESYYDTKTRLEHEKVQAEQLEKIMEQAETIEDILAVRKELSSVQERIEVFEGKMRMWDSLVDYSTIDISISPTPTIETSNEPRFIKLNETGRAIVKALRNSVVFVANFFQRLFVVLAALLLPAAIVTPIVVLIVKLTKRSKNKKKEKQKEE